MRHGVLKALNKLKLFDPNSSNHFPGEMLEFFQGKFCWLPKISKKRSLRSTLFISFVVVRIEAGKFV